MEFFLFESKFSVGGDTFFLQSLGPKSKLHFSFHTRRDCKLFSPLVDIFFTIPQKKDLPGASQINAFSFHFTILSLTCKPYYSFWNKVKYDLMRAGFLLPKNVPIRNAFMWGMFTILVKVGNRQSLELLCKGRLSMLISSTASKKLM